MKSVWVALLLVPALALPARAAAPQSTVVERLERDAARLEATRSVRHLQRAWGFYIDRALWNEAADLFAADATLELDGDGVYAGRDRIRQYLLQRGGGQQGLRWASWPNTSNCSR